MPQPVFTTNDSEFTRLEGLYIKERNPPAVISGVNLGTVGVVGTAIRGPVNKAVLIGNQARFFEVYGGRDQGSGGAVTSALWKSLANKPFGSLKIVRAAAAAAVTATENFANVTPTDIIKVDASSPGAWGNNVEVKIEAASDGDANHFNLTAKYLGKEYIYKNLNTFTASDDNLLETIGDDDGNVIVVTKLANGRPLNAAYTALTTGADGTVAASDFTGAGKAFDLIDGQKDVGVVFVAELGSTGFAAALKADMATRAGTATNRMYLMSPDTLATAQATAITDAASYRSDRIVYCFNAPYTLDPETGTEMQTDPSSWVASILSQTDVDIHPGEEDTKQFTAGMTRLTFATLDRADYIALREAGIAAFEEDDGFALVSGVTTSLTPGKEQITRRRMTDFLQISIANTLKYSVKKKNTFTRKKANQGMIEAFLGDLKKAERVVLDFSVDPDVLNTPSQEAAGIVKILVRIRLIGHMLHLVLETEIGTSVTISESA